MDKHFEQPSVVERAFNRMFGSLVRIGAMPSYNRVLEVRGRKSGKLYTTPVYVLEFEGKLWLVGPRGETQWVRNAEAGGEVTLARGRDRRVYGVRLVPTAQRAPLLREYLERHYGTVQRFFSVQRGAALAEFEAIADRHPVFELIAR
jgi:deazaflavin-dependent oxidoreductase (nitroreductase family)